MLRTPPLSLLQIVPNYAAKPTGGAPARILYLGASLARHMDVTQAGFLPPGHTGPAPEPPEDTPPTQHFVPVPRSGAYRAADLVWGALGRVPFSVRNYTRTEMRAAIARLLEERRFDIVLLEGVHMGEYLPLVSSGGRRPLIVSDWHNIESEILRRYGQAASSPWRKAYARHAAGKLESYERWFVNQCDLHVTVSERDRERLIGDYGCGKPVVVIENGIPFAYFAGEASAQDRQRPRSRILFVGAMDYHANVAAAQDFAREVWPALRAAAPHLVFTVVGRNPPPALRALAGSDGIEITGTVPDVRPYYRDAVAAVVPLRVGGGTRIKILEAMAAGVPVVSTVLGAEGLTATPGEHYLLADSSAQMLAALQGLLADPARAERLSAAGRDFVHRRHDWSLLGDQLARHLLELASKTVAGTTVKP